MSADHSTETRGDNLNRSLVPLLELFVDSDVKSNPTYRNVSFTRGRNISQGMEVKSASSYARGDCMVQLQ